MSLVLLILSTVCFIITFRIILALYHNYIIRQKYKDIPGMYPWLFIGNSLTLMKMTDIERKRWHDSLAYKFQDDLFIVWFGMEPVFHVFKPEYVQVILCGSVNIEKEVLATFLKPWLGNGLLTSEGAQWLHNRKLIEPTFHFSILEKFVETFSEKAAILIKCLEKEIAKHPGEPIDIFPFAINVTLDIICETAMGVNIRAQETAQEIGYCMDVKRVTKLTADRINRPWYWPDWIFYSMPIGKEYKMRLDRLHGFTKEIINKRKSARKSEINREEVANDESEYHMVLLAMIKHQQRRKAFLDLLLDQNDMDDKPLSDDELREQVDTFMFAGHDTIAATITLVLFCLGNYVEYQEKVHEELEEVFGDLQAPISMKELSQLKYLDRVIRESLRLYPTVPMIGRELKDDIKLGDYNISKGATIILSINSVHKNERFWPDPLKFDPDRFLPENSKNRNPYAYIPFGVGSRNCIGQKFALLEGKTVLAAILRKWRVKSLITPNDIKLSVSITLRPEEKIPIQFIPK